jgi:hypothetical protein
MGLRTVSASSNFASTIYHKLNRTLTLIKEQELQTDVWKEDESERMRIRQFWLGLNNQSRRQLIKLEKEQVNNNFF